MRASKADWEPCAEAGCGGGSLPTGGKCWAHADESDLETALERLNGGGPLDAPGVPISGDLWQRLHDALPKGPGGRQLSWGDFRSATFLDTTSFAAVRLLGVSKFQDAVFEGEVRFNSASFEGSVRFERVKFDRLAVFYDTTFRRTADFSWATFTGVAWFDGAAFQADAKFHGATFLEAATFNKATELDKPDEARVATFNGLAMFSSATFVKEAEFTEARFERVAMFPGTTFKGSARFSEAVFEDLAVFGQATGAFEPPSFLGPAQFSRARFQSWASFDRATFETDGWFTKATFQDRAGFDRTAFGRVAGFDGAVFQNEAGFTMATVGCDARFAKAVFEGARQLGPMQVRRQLVLDQAVFKQRIQVAASAARVCGCGAEFRAGVQFQLRWAEIMLDDADLAAPSILAGVPPFDGLDERRLTRLPERLRPTHTPQGRPRLISLRRADVAGLTVAGVDLRACRFAGAHHLDQLRVEEAEFPSAPAGWRWTTRQTIAEEHHWRAARQNPPDGQDTLMARARSNRDGEAVDWYGAANRPPAWLEVEPPTATQTATVYRALRKGREDNKDEPGAADFYYGEMEMRRHDRTKPSSERLVVLLYWVFSGYALRASRALIWLLGVLAVASVLLAAAGLQPPSAAAEWSFPTRLGTAVLVAVEGAVFRASEQELTYTGRLIQAVLRFAGPILLGLAVLSVRGRVKR